MSLITLSNWMDGVMFSMVYVLLTCSFHEISFGLDVVVLQLVMESYWIGKTFSKGLRNNQSTLLLL